MGKEEEKKAAAKVSEKKKLSEKIKEKENRLRKKLEEIKAKEIQDMTPEEQQAERLRVKKLQEAADLELAKEAFGIVGGPENIVNGIDAMSPSSKDDFTEFEKLL